MTFLFRKLDKRRRWDKEETEKKFSWLSSEDVPSDCLRELETDSCALSFWLIDDTQSNLNRVLAALAANRPSLAEVDFGLVDFELIQNAGFNFDENLGDTADDEANYWHIDISKLSAQNLVGLAELLWGNMVTDRRTRKQILDFMVDSVNDNYLDRSKIKTQSDELEARLNT